MQRCARAVREATNSRPGRPFEMAKSEEMKALLTASSSELHEAVAAGDVALVDHSSEDRLRAQEQLLLNS